jgi:predicted DNA-binding transcriptional regulator AlpA
MEEVKGKIFLDSTEMSGRLGVRKSWLYRQCMKRGPGSIPRLKVGKYTKYIEEEVVFWIRKQSEEALQ